MPDIPVPDSDDSLDAAPPPPPVHYVEQALLGALLLEPHRRAEITNITAASFAHPAHGAVFTAISTTPAPDSQQHGRDATWLNSVYTTARRHDHALTPAYPHTLIQTCPQPRHASAYARIIEADHDRRRLNTAAQHLLLTAQDTSLPHPVPVVLAAADALASTLDDIRTTGSPRSGTPPRMPSPAAVDAHRDEQAAAEERLLLACATAHPEDVERIRWLHHEDFTDPLHAGLWQCLRELIRRSTPVDPVTVLAQAQYHGLLHPPVEPAALLDLLSEPAASTEHWALRTLQRALLTTAQQTARRITTLTDDPAITPHHLVVGSRRAFVRLVAVRTRWQHAVSPPTPAKPVSRKRASAPTPPRASPPLTTRPAAPSASR